MGPVSQIRWVILVWLTDKGRVWKFDPLDGFANVTGLLGNVFSRCSLGNQFRRAGRDVVVIGRTRGGSQAFFARLAGGEVEIVGGEGEVGEIRRGLVLAIYPGLGLNCGAPTGQRPSESPVESHA